jgi:hypothetical protein
MSNDIRLLHLSNYIRPKLEENKAKNWVLNGKDNKFYQYVIDRFNGSPTNAAVNNSYIDLLYGKGLSARNRNTSQWIEFVSKLNPKEVRKILSDFQLFGEATFQVIKAKNKADLGAIYHLPKEQVVPSLENEDGEITSYWHCKNWKDIRNNEPKEYSAFGTSNDEIEIYSIKPYKAGKNYFSDPDYLACLPYCEMEEELANFYINSIKKGLSAGYIINIKDGGSYTTEQKDELEHKIKQKLTGSPNAMNFIINFAGMEANIEIVPFPVNDAQHKQWEYLTGEARQQIMTGHRVVSPMLFGIKDSSGFGNNADELDTAEAQLMKRIIAPKQAHVIDALKEVLEYYKINLDLYFLPLTDAPIENNTRLSIDEKKKTDLDLFLELGIDEEIEGYEIESVEAVDYEKEDAIQLASVATGVARSNAGSKWDTEFYLFRYRYAGNPSPERQFCKSMISANKIYRREDIELMGDKNVNPGFGMHPNPNNPYSIWKFKGGGLLSATYTGGTCKHYWEKLTYRKQGVKIDVKSPIAVRDAKIDKASGEAGIAPHDK